MLIEEMLFMMCWWINYLDQAQRQSCANVYSEMSGTQINSPPSPGDRGGRDKGEAEMFRKTYRGPDQCCHC